MFTRVRDITRTALAAMAACAVSAAVLVAISSAPAYAHTQSEAVEAGCGTNYAILAGGIREVTTQEGEVWGEAILTYNANNGYFCMVTRKIAFHGVATRVIAGLYHESEGVVFTDKAKVTHLVSVKLYGNGECTRYYGRVYDPNGNGSYGGMNPTEGYVCP